MGCCAAGDIGSVDLAQCVRFPGEAPAGMEQPEEPSGLLYSRGSDRTWLYDLEECDIGVLKIKKIMENVQKKEKTYWLLAFLLAVLYSITVWFGLFLPVESMYVPYDDEIPNYVKVLFYTFGAVVFVICLMAFFGILNFLLFIFRKFLTFPKGLVGIWIYVVVLSAIISVRIYDTVQEKKELILAKTDVGISSINSLITPEVSMDEVKGILGVPSEIKQYGEVESYIYNFLVFFKEGKVVRVGDCDNSNMIAGWFSENKEDSAKLSEIIENMGFKEVKKFLGEPVDGETWTDGTYVQLYPIRVIFLNGKVEDCAAWNDLWKRLRGKAKLKQHS